MKPIKNQLPIELEQERLILFGGRYLRADFIKRNLHIPFEHTRVNFG